MPALGVSVKSVRLVAERLWFYAYSRSGRTKHFKNRIGSFRVRRSAQAEVQRFCVCVFRHVCPLTAFNHS